jgi:cyanophycin synthetase
MEFRNVLALRGPNLWANFPVLEAWVDLGLWKDTSSEMVPGFTERLMNWLPGLIEHRCSVGTRGGFLERLRRGTYPAHILEHVTLELQTLAGSDLGFGRARETSEEGVYKVVVRYEEESLARECLKVGRQLVLAAFQDEPFDASTEIARLRDLGERVLLGPSTRSIVEAARERGIPVRRLNTGSLVQLGYGKKIRRIRAAETDATGSIAEGIAQDKDLTRRLLQEAGVPVPQGEPVSSADEAWEVAQDLGLPVVVKPQDGNQGRGVATNLTTEQQVRHAYQAAALEGESVVVERHIAGKDHRLLVVGERLVAAARRDPPKVIGDGSHTIAQLIDKINADPRRGDHHGTVLSKIHLDSIALATLADQGHSAESVPAAGETIVIRRNANLSTGGTAVDVTDDVHPEVARRVIEAVRVVGLDIAGVDVVATDIGRPLESQGAAVIEVNAAPGLRMHLAPSEGTPRPVGQAIVNLLYPPGESGRIPVVAVTGVNGKTTTTRMIAHILRGTGRLVGMTCTDGIFIGSRRIDSGDCSGPKSARAVLANPQVEAAVLETARGGILREGLGFDRCDVGVVTNIGEGDHLGLSDIHTLEDLARVKRVVVEAVSPTGTAVLNAADPLVAAMAEKCRGSIVYFALDAENPIVQEHRNKGGRAVFVRGNVVLASGDQDIPIIAVDHIPLTQGGRIRFQVENTLAAVAAAWAAGVPVETIIHRLQQFDSSLDLAPARFNVLEMNGATVILDYGHNASALGALIDALDEVSQSHRTVVYSTAGDRRDDDMVRQGQLLGAGFDRVILYEDHYRRGRQPGEIIARFRQGLADASRVREVLEVQGALKALDLGLSLVKPGELLVIQADEVHESVDHMRRRLAEQPLPVALNA